MLFGYWEVEVSLCLKDLTHFCTHREAPEPETELPVTILRVF